ncbi:flavin monoamine oxidase family protein [Saccharopolyspora sp. K220]|uniref:flavin monoamine oxidase family protein n=1 Tax=Saccharopolyspora soli TaxID=2926618 RepID=UPI001F5AF8F3|nr:flavin monoamine oxidase family protein [Saccharopolyspora soli]MCI2417941.1 flavin monoamine oxidase family protein [Saccharopolyspora soli]
MFEAMRALGLVAAPQALAVPDFRSPSVGDLNAAQRGKHVVILGAGIAGLATAYEFGKAGYRCTVLEAKDRVGGRNWTVRGGTSETDLDGHAQTARFANGHYLNAGPARLPQSHITLDYCRELGIPIEPFINQNANALIYNEQTGAPVQQYRTAKADVYGYVSELLAKALDQGALDQELSAADKDRLLTFLSGFGAIGDKADGFAYRGTDRRGYRVEPGAADQAGEVLGPPPSLREVLASQVGRYFSFEFGYDQAMAMFQPVGGMDAVPMALHRAIGADKIRLGAEVTRITDLPGRVEVGYRDKRGTEQLVTADFCVATLPPHIMARIPTNLDPRVAAALRFPTVNPVGKIGLEYRRRWWEEDARIYGGITETDMDLAHIWYPSYGFQGQRGVVVGYYNTGKNATTYGSLAPAQRIDRAVAQGAKIHGATYRDELVSAFSVAWHRTPFIEGGWVDWPSRTSGEYALLNQPAGRVYFAGDWLSYFIAWQAGAFDSARYAVTNIHNRVRAGG